MHRVFIQVCCKYPHGNALANYIQSMAKAILYAGYEVILVTNINEEYDFATIVRINGQIAIRPVMPSSNAVIKEQQRLTGYCEERLGVLKEYNIDKNDGIIVLNLESEYFLNQLFEMGKK